jgi:hypothetical protein
MDIFQNLAVDLDTEGNLKCSLYKSNRDMKHEHEHEDESARAVSASWAQRL